MSVSTKSVKPFGEWKTPISSAIATAKASRFQDLVLDVTDNGNDVVYWSEIRFDEGGRTVVSSCEVGKSEPKDWTPAGFSARTTVHEYGGGNIFVHKGTLYFSNFSDQRLYKQLAPDFTPTPVTAADTSYRYANGHMSAKTNLIYIIREDHSKVESGQAKEPTNSVICLDPSTQQEKVLACGADFYSTPKVSLDGEKICWVQWFHPSMPWYDTELWTAKLTKSGDAIIEGSAKKVAGGKDVSVMIPRWTPSGELRFISDENNWWNVYESASDGSITNIYKMDQEIGRPAWLFGNQPYDTNPSSPGEYVVSCDGLLTLMENGVKKKTFNTGFTSHLLLNFSESGKIYCFAHSAIQASTLISVSTLDGKVEILRKSQQVDIDEGYLSKFTEICYNTTDGGKSYANYYKPTNKDYEGPDGELPPLLVKAHGGPTSSATTSLQLPIQYFTSRGFAVLDVNYRGSTGYGREYRLKLADKWGIYDVDDCCAAAQHLADNKLVDRNKLCIDGGSAGGYTTLACLAFKDVFKAGASHYGVADLELLAKDTHKFESRYLDNLIGVYPQQRNIYIQRSPIHNVDGFNSPIIFFQGTEDKVVPPNQAQMMFDSVEKKGIPCSLVMFEGEQHGFRKSENIQTALDGELYFYSKILKFEADLPDGISDKISISNYA